MSPVPPPPGEPNLQLFIPVTQPPPVLPPPPPLPRYALPRYASDFPLSQPATQFWLATLARASYGATSTFFNQAARAVVPGDYPVTFVPNGIGLTPGYGVVKLPQGAVVVVSGTTNLGQWQEQLFANGLTQVGDMGWEFVKGGTMPVYRAAAVAILAALAPLVPADQQILFVGHSMGGAVAELLHALTTSLNSPRAASRCLTFGAPKPGDSRLVGLMRTNSQVFRRLILAGDFIPALPPDLGLLNVAVPAPFSAVSSNWSRFRQPSVAYYLSSLGVVEAGVEPFLPLLMIGAMVAAAASLPIVPSSNHIMRTYCAFLAAAGGGALPEDHTQGWADPNSLFSLNSQMSDAGL